jgi:flagellin-like hook-associated protein FlgL
MRVGTLGQNVAWLSRIREMQASLDELQFQVASGKKSKNYAGIAPDVASLLNFEAENASAKAHAAANVTVDTRLAASALAADGVGTAVRTFSKQLDAFRSGNTADRSAISQIQQFAFRALIDVQSYLGSDVGGRALFAGGRLDAAAVDIGASTLDDFQTKWNGDAAQWPMTRVGQLSSASVQATDLGGLTFSPAAGVVSAASASALSAFPSGSVVSFSNTAFNNSSMQVTSHAAMNTAGQPLAETGGTGSGSPTITWGNPAAVIAPASTGDIDFSFAPDGSMLATPTTANALSAVSAGSRITIDGSAGGAWDGAFLVKSNAGGSIALIPDPSLAAAEAIDQTGPSIPLSVTRNHATGAALTTGPISFSSSVSGGRTTVTMTSSGNDFAGWSAGDVATLSGSTSHDGSFKVSAATANSISFVANGDALRISRILPQSGRSDVTLSFGAAPGATSSILSAAGGTSGASGYGALSFSPTGAAGARISASAGASSFKDGAGNPFPAVGQVISLKSASGVNDGSYAVIANAGDHIEIAATRMTAESAMTASAATSSWYKGDDLRSFHRIDDRERIADGVSASSPGFEKAIRAMGMIAQGVFGSSGGLDGNQGRIDQAMSLLNDAMGVSTLTTEAPGTIPAIQSELGFSHQRIAARNATHSAFSELLQTRIDGITQADQTTAIASLLSEANALQASYMAMAKIQGLSLMNYLK